MKIEIIEEARIKCIKPADLDIDDMILINNIKCKVTHIINSNVEEYSGNFAIIEPSIGVKASRRVIKKYRNYYLILSIEKSHIEEVDVLELWNNKNKRTR